MEKQGGTQKYVEIELSRESAEALAFAENVERWNVAPTMLARGKKKNSDDFGKAQSAVSKGKEKKKNLKVDKKLLLFKRGRNNAAKQDSGDMDGDHFTEDSFRRSENGRNAVRKFMTQLREMERTIFFEAPSFGLKGECRLRHDAAAVLTWEQMLEAAPRVLECLFLELLFSGMGPSAGGLPHHTASTFQDKSILLMCCMSRFSLDHSGCTHPFSRNK